MAYYQIALRLLLSFIIAVSPIILINSANAANVGGWLLSNPVAQGASTVYDATKNVVINGKDFVKDSWVKITPTASGVAKVLARGAAGYALSVAVEQLIGAVDWVLDPANNQIKYIKDVEYTTDTYFKVQGGAPSKSPLEACKNYAQLVMNNNSGRWTSSKAFSVTSPDSNKFFKCSFILVEPSGWESVFSNVSGIMVGETLTEEEEKTIPLETVAQRVISNAESGDTNAQVATTAAAADIVADAETDQSKARPIANQADANAETKPADPDAAASANSGSATATPQADPVTGDQAPPTDISLEFPVFCNWAPTICQAAQVVISFPNTLTGWWESANQKVDDWATSISEAWAAAKDWATTQNQDEPTELEIPQPEQQAVDTDISFNASCPAPYTLASFTAFGNSYNWTIDFSDMCSAITTFVRPVVIAMGALSAALIVGGVRDNG